MSTFDAFKQWLDERDEQVRKSLNDAAAEADILDAEVTRLNGLLTEKNAEISAKDAAVLALQRTEATLRGQITTLNGEVSRLTTALEACEDGEDGEPDPDPDPPVSRNMILGMSAPATDWPARINEVGRDGITARRIFADVLDGPQDQRAAIEAALRDGMIPVISYKMGKGDVGKANVPRAINGELDDEFKAAAAFLKSYNKPMYVTVWHEPNGDMTGPQLVMLHNRLLPFFRTPLIKVGCFLNGWQLTAPNEMDDFKAYTSKTLLANVYDFFGIDSYQNPNKLGTNPGDRIPPLLNLLREYGYPDFPIGIGEYNAHTADDVREAGEKFLSTPSVEFAMMWNANGSGTAQATVLTGDRLTAFKATKADERVAR